MTGFKNATSYAQTLCASSKKMRLIGQILLFLTIISCTRNNDKELTSDSNDTFDTLNTFALLNYLLTDTTEIGLVKDGYKVISDIDMLPPPMWTGEGSFKKHLSEVLMEKDTLHIIKQLKELKNFRTDELVKYGFTVVKVSEMRAMKMTGEMFWDKIYKDYGPGLLTVSRTTACFCNGAVTSWFKVLSSFNVFVSWDRTRLRKGTTAETQTLAAIAN
jgi:hypothetical protein